MERISKWLTGRAQGAVLARAAIAVLAALGVLDVAGQMRAGDAVACLEEVLRSD